MANGTHVYNSHLIYLLSSYIGTDATKALYVRLKELAVDGESK